MKKNILWILIALLIVILYLQQKGYIESFTFRQYGEVGSIPPLNERRFGDNGYYYQDSYNAYYYDRFLLH
jgi:hypothetical protein